MEKQLSVEDGREKIQEEKKSEVFLERDMTVADRQPLISMAVIVQVELTSVRRPLVGKEDIVEF